MMIWWRLAAATAVLMASGCASAPSRQAEVAPAAGAAPAPADEEAGDAASRRLFMLELAQAVDDRCHLMPAEVRRDFDGRVQRLANELASTAGPAATAPLAGEARRRAESGAQRCDGATERFLRESVATARRLTS